jgi:biotin carboxyl carrier protein
MVYISDIQENHYKIETDANDQRRTIVLDGKQLGIDWRQVAPLAADAQGHVALGGRYTLLVGGKSYEVFARYLDRPDETAGQTYEVVVAGQSFEVHVEDERERALVGSLKASQVAGDITVRAPMPGLVLSVLKEVGAEVARGETVAVLEAMKMENDLTTPHDGIVKEIHVKEGQTVNQGDILMVIAGN